MRNTLWILPIFLVCSAFALILPQSAKGESESILDRLIKLDENSNDSSSLNSEEVQPPEEMATTEEPSGSGDSSSLNSEDEAPPMDEEAA